MRKLAVYVEGDTEQEFVARFIAEVAGERNVLIERSEATGGRKSPRQIHIIEAARPATDERFYVLIVNCCGESRVASDVRDSYGGHVAQGFQDIIAIRDVYPEFTYAQVAQLRAGLMAGMPTNPFAPLFVLGVMEIEAWFLAEHTHFQRLHPNLTCAEISARLGFDPSTEDMQTRGEAADDLDRAYSLVGFRYRKKRSQIQRTVQLLDYAALFVTPPAFPDLKSFNARIEAFVA